MKRWLRILLNIGLMVLSVALTLEVAAWCDRALGPFVTAKLWPGRMGLILEPGREDEFDTCDFHCFVHVNSMGFRDHEVTLQKTCKYRVLAVGDSFTYGWGVNIEDAWCKRMERTLREQGMDIEILNLAKPGAGPDEYVEIVADVVPVLRPDLVLVGVLAGDDLQQVSSVLHPVTAFRANFRNSRHLARYLWHHNDNVSSWQPPKQNASQQHDGYKSQAQDILRQMTPEMHKRFDQLEEHVKDVFYSGLLNPWMIAHSTGAPDYFMNTVNIDLLGERIDSVALAFKRLKRAARQYGADVIVCSIPEGFYVNKEAFKNVQRIGFHVVPEMLGGTAADDAIRQACERNDIRFHCVSDGFRKKMDEPGLYFELDRHMSAAGNALYAELLTPLIAADIGDAARPQH